MKNYTFKDIMFVHDKLNDTYNVFSGVKRHEDGSITYVDKRTSRNAREACNCFIAQIEYVLLKEADEVMGGVI